jgi:hypothetical protein
MQLLARMLESVTDSKRQFGIALVLRRALDIHLMIFREKKADMHFIQAAFVVMLTGCFHYDPAGGYSAKAFIKFSYMRSDRFLDLRRSLHALKLDFGRSFHFPYLAMITALTYHAYNPDGARAMSALGQKQTSDRRPLMSALPPKADIAGRDRHVRFLPIGDIGPYSRERD